MFRFSVRELVAIALATALAVAWIVEHQRFQASNKVGELWKQRFCDQKDHIERQLTKYGLDIGETEHYGLIVTKIDASEKHPEDPFAP